MEALSPWHLLILGLLALLGAAWVYPAWRILSRLGLSPVWSLVMLVPVLNIIAIWLLAIAGWEVPADANSRSLRPS